MPEKDKKKPLPDQATVKGNWFVWKPVNPMDEDLAEVELPLRLSAGQIADLGNVQANIAGFIYALTELAPKHKDTYPEQDSVDLQHMYQTWTRVFEERAEATLGE